MGSSIHRHLYDNPNNHHLPKARKASARLGIFDSQGDEMKLLLTRCVSSDKGTFGVLSLDNEPLCVTCEDPWNDNKRQVSCIPTGTYECKKFSGLRFKDVWELLNVPGRSAILIHAGNTIDDTHGCILVGRSFSHMGKLPSVMQSREALNELRLKLPDTFTLEVR
jgi:hypothetical protein